jgi:hypothetical protein
LSTPTLGKNERARYLPAFACAHPIEMFVSGVERWTSL